MSVRQVHTVEIKCDGGLDPQGRARQCQNGITFQGFSQKRAIEAAKTKGWKFVFGTTAFCSDCRSPFSETTGCLPAQSREEYAQ